MGTVNTAIDLAMDFYDAYLIQRDVEACLKLLTEDFQYYGTSAFERGHNKEEAACFLEDEIRKMPDAFKVSYQEVDEVPTGEGTGTAFISATASMDGEMEVHISFRGTVVTRLDRGQPYICALHMSMASELQADGEYFPITVVENRIQSVKRQLMGKSIPGGLMGGYLEDRFPFYYVNDRMLQYLGYTSEAAFIEAIDGYISNCMHEEDQERVDQEVNTQLAENGEYAVEYRMRKKDGSFIWVHDLGRQIQAENGRPAVISSCYDITEQREAQRKLELNEARLKVYLKHISFFHWEYDAQTKCAELSSHLADTFAVPEKMEGYPESLVAAGVIHPDSVEEFLQMHRLLAEGEPYAESEIKAIGKDGKILYMEVRYTNILDECGIPMKAVGTAVDTTKNHILSEQYVKELAYREEMASSNAVMSLRINVTKNKVEDYSPEYRFIDEEEENDYNVIIHKIAMLLPVKEQRENFLSVFEPEVLLEAYTSGRTQFDLEYERVMEHGEAEWVSTAVRLLKAPLTEDVVFFSYTRNINEIKVVNNLIDSVIASDFDFIAHVDIHRNRYKVYSVNGEGTNLLLGSGTDYEGTVRAYMHRYANAADCERCCEELSLDRIRAALEKKKTYTVLYGIHNEEGRAAYKKIKAFYTDKDQRRICVTGTDVTLIYKEEQDKNQVLTDALAVARQASVAKSEFLSRMSHEIRTPMNAIIGMTTIASQVVNDPVQVADCLSKISISSQFLLSLINDILDMSRIESGKVSLKMEEIHLEEFLKSINTIVYAQAEAKGVDYESVIMGIMEECYIGDQMKLQQILVNILSNAVKFTAEGGKVQLTVKKTRSQPEGVGIRFYISDTGCGMSEQFMKQIFEPFSQEHSGSTSMYGGTGLGLAISKNLVNLMNGKIDVRSIEGVGSEFIIEVKLAVKKDIHAPVSLPERLQLADMQVLVVDDDATICEHTQLILSDMGMHAEWVNSGRQAVERVSDKWKNEQYYDIIFVDWKMPEMDGIETTRQIRRIVGPDVTIIIMTAYDWALIEREAKAEGVNLLMDKPMFRNSLRTVFEKVWGNQKQRKESGKARRLNLEGARVLLVEDHELNIEVAKRLLEKKGVLVEVAENGLKGLQKFTLSLEGYYDAILMDIRMPVMDGLDCAKNIRMLDKEGAKEIPIIAMSANAFEEDVEKSGAAGMNAHLSKPIDPKQLYQVLNNQIASHK